MDDQIDQHKILESYFPKERDWWIDFDWDDNDPTQPEATIKLEFDNWVSRAIKDDGCMSSNEFVPRVDIN